jgi:CDP-diglyceride synthetase
MIDWSGFIAGWLTGALVGSFITMIAIYDGKTECEATLPRNVQCVWTAPEEYR